MLERKALSCSYTADLRALMAERLAQFDVIRRDAAGLIPAAVAIVIAALEERATAGTMMEAAFLLTARTPRLRAHGGQLALPGGRIDPDESIERAALRELSEELGMALPPTAIIGRLDDYARAPVTSSRRSSYGLRPRLERGQAVRRSRESIASLWSSSAGTMRRNS